MTTPTIADRVAASRAAQGLPPKITDTDALARVATIVRAAARGGGRDG